MKKISMFVVEDDLNDILFLKRALKKAQIDISMEICQDGETAIQNLQTLAQNRSHSPAVLPAFILLDLKIPRVSGFDVLRWVRNHPVLWSIPVIVFSSSNQARDIRQAYDFGANSYLVKPVDFTSLSRHVSLLCNYWGRLNEMAL